MKEHADSIVNVICITVLVILFAGEPDIQDAIIDYLKKP